MLNNQRSLARCSQCLMMLSHHKKLSLWMGDVMNFNIEQIKPDTKYLLVKYDSTRFVSSHQQESFHKALRTLADKTGLNVAAIDKSIAIEQLSDEDLANVGLMRINNNA